MMKRALIACIALAGCSTPPKEPDKPKTKCEMVAAALAHEYVDPGVKLAALEIGRNHGCFGTPPPARAEITIKRE